MSVIGFGAFGTVYKTLHAGRICATKICRTKKVDIPADFLNEICHLTKLKHPGIVELKDINLEDGFKFTMPLYGNNLRNWIASRGYIDFDVIKNIMFQLAQALNYIHKNGYIHRDLKTENILIDTINDKLVVKIADFNSCKYVGINPVKLEQHIQTIWYQIGRAH